MSEEKKQETSAPVEVKEQPKEEIKAEQKLFTQEQLDNIIQARIMSERKKYEKKIEEEEKQKTELLKQNQYSPLTVAEQVVSIFTGVSGYLDNIELNKIKKFETDLLEKVKNDFPEILENINSSGKLEDEIKKKLIEVIESQKKEVKNA